MACSTSMSGPGRPLSSATMRRTAVSSAAAKVFISQQVYVRTGASGLHTAAGRCPVMPRKGLTCLYAGDQSTLPRSCLALRTVVYIPFHNGRGTGALFAGLLLLTGTARAGLAEFAGSL